MPKFETQFFSIVFVGKLNPQILTHDFLINNHVLPEDQEPFKSLLSQNSKSQFSEFISTPVLTTLRYNEISIFIDETRYQIIHRGCIDPTKSSIVSITRTYFGKLLRYTPLQLGGINFNGNIIFESEEAEEKFDHQIGINRGNLIKATGAKKIRMNWGMNYEWEGGIVELQFPKPKDRNLPCSTNFNYE